MFRAGFLALTLCFALLPQSALSGAWKRALGTGFAATSFALRNTDQGLTTEFGYHRDFGLNSRFDLGIDLNQVGSQSGHALLFARLPLRQRPNATRLATELALGGNHSQGVWQPMYRLTVSAGRGFATRQGNLWGNLDLIYEKRGDAQHALWKLDGSFGLTTGRRLSPLLQIETAFGNGTDFSYAITPSIRLSLSGLSLPAPKVFETSELVIGIEYRQAKTQSLGLKIALWQRF